MSGISMFGELLPILIYKKCFEITKNIGGYWLMMAIINCVICLLGAFTLKDYSHLVAKSENTEKSSLNPSRDKDTGEEIHGKSLFTRFDFHIFCWAHILTVTFHHTIMLNLMVMLSSYDMVNLSLTVMTVLPLFGAIMRFVLGGISDYFIDTIPRTMFICLATWAQAVTIFPLLVYGGSFSIIISCFSALYVCNALYFSLFPTVLSEMYGKKSFSINWGIVLVGNALINLPVLYIFGFFYDKSTMADESSCMGSGCFTVILMFGGVVSSVAAIFISIIVYYEFRWRRDSISNTLNPS